MNRRRIVTIAPVLTLSLLVIGSLVSSHAAEVVVFWNIHGTARGEAWQVLVDELNETRTDLRIVLEQPASGTEGVNQLLVAVAAGTPPDLVYLDRGYVGQHMGTGIFEPLNAYVERAGWDMEREWFDRAIPRVSMGGKLYGIPVDAFPLTYLVWNKRIFEEAGLDGDQPPVTYAEMDEMAWQLTRRPEASGGSVLVGLDPWLGAALVHYGIWMLLWETWMWDDEAKRASLTHPRSLELAEWHVKHAQRLQGIHPGSWSGDPFVSEQLAMRIVTTTQITNWEHQGVSFEWGMGTLPLLPWQERPSLYVAGEGLAILAGSRRKERAWEVMEWLLREENAVRFALQTGIPPARISTLREYAARVETEREREMLDLLLSAQLVAVPNWPVGYGILNTETFPAIRNLQRDPLSALSDAEEVLQGIVDDHIRVHGPWW